MSQSALSRSQNIPEPSAIQEDGIRMTRKRAARSDVAVQSSKQRRQHPSGAPASDPIAHWAEHKEWPSSFTDALPASQIPLPPLSLRTNSSPGVGHWSELGKRLRDERIHSEDEGPELHEDDTAIVDQLERKTENTAVAYFAIPPDKLKVVSDYVSGRNEAAVRTYILPLVAPSPTLLRVGGSEIDLKGLGEEYNTQWTRARPFLKTCPRPDYMVGLDENAFTEEDFLTLQKFATLDNSVFATRRICLPFLICEIKSSQAESVHAERLSVHSAALAVRAVFSLYEAAYGKDSSKVRGLEGRILVFSIVHDHKDIELYGHYALGADAATRKYYRRQFGTTNLLCPESSQIDAHNYVRNIYQDFAPLHIKRVKDALSHLPATALGRGFPDGLEMEELDWGEPDWKEPVSEFDFEQEQLKQQIGQLKRQIQQQQKATQERQESMSKQIQQQQGQMQRQKASQRRKEKMQQQMQQRQMRMQPQQDEMQRQKANKEREDRRLRRARRREE